MTEDIPTPREMTHRLVEASRAVEEAHGELVRLTREAAETERLYRQARSQAWLTATEGTAQQKADHVNAVTADRAYAAHLADGLTKAAMELVRSRRAVLSALQTTSAYVRSEAELLRYGGGGP